MNKTFHPVWLSLVFLILVFPLAGTGASVSEPLLNGTLYDFQGKPVRNADICLYKTDFYITDATSGSRFPSGASRCRKTDKDGNYSLFLPDRSTYLLIAGKKSSWTMRHIATAYGADTITTSDTLQPTGNLTFKITTGQKKDNRATVSLAGTPYLFTSDTSGVIRITAVPAGTYGAVIKSLHKGYRAVLCSLRVRSSEIDSFPDPLLIPPEQVAFVPTTAKMISLDMKQLVTPLAAQPETPLIPSVPEPAVTAAKPERTSEIPVKQTSPLQHKPPSATAPSDTFIGIFEPLQLTGKANVDGDTYQMSWDIGATGKFIPTENGSIELRPFKTPVNRLRCIFKVNDSRGAIATDTTYVYAGLLWMSISPPKELLGRNGHSLISFNNELYIIGGNRSDAWSSSDGINWTMLTNTAPFGKIFGHATVVFNNRLWIFGGKTGNNTFNTSVWSSSTGIQWQREAASPFEKRIYHTATVFRNKIYIIGGITDSENEPFLNDVWVTSDGINWSRANENAPFGKRYGHGCTVFNDRIIMLGGFNDAIGNQLSYNDVWESSDGITWTAITEKAPFAKELYHSVISFDNRLWAIGGYGRNGTTDYFADVFFSSEGSTWTNLTPDKKTTDRFFCTATPFHDRIIISPSDSHKLWIMR